MLAHLRAKAKEFGAGFAVALLRRNPHTLQAHLPTLYPKVNGFTLALERMPGCELQSRPKDSGDEVPYKDAGVAEHFLVTVNCDGTNPDYKEKKGPWKRVITNALKEDLGSGMAGGIIFAGPGATFTKVEVVETYEKGGNNEIGFYPIDPRFVVWLRVTAIDRHGSKSSTSIGLTSRPVRH